jgi:hypothetical protein
MRALMTAPRNDLLQFKIKERFLVRAQALGRAAEINLRSRNPEY